MREPPLNNALAEPHTAPRKAPGPQLVSVLVDPALCHVQALRYFFGGESVVAVLPRHRCQGSDWLDVVGDPLT